MFTSRYLNVEKVREVEDLSIVKGAKLPAGEIVLKLFWQTQKTDK
jgi:hypothetical protein